ncbi:MAG: NfeD family protein [Ruminococcus sp.]|nr:NfeD family protein [Ruminococcus sp.]
MDIILWAVLIIVFVIVEFCTVQLVSIWLAIASLITLICTLCFDSLSFIGQTTIFVLTSAVLVTVTLPLIRKRLNKTHVATNSKLEIGKTATVIEKIDPDKNTGRVTLNGVDWGAVSADGKIIPKDSIVVIKEIKSTKLIVEIKS